MRKSVNVATPVLARTERTPERYGTLIPLEFRRRTDTIDAYSATGMPFASAGMIWTTIVKGSPDCVGVGLAETVRLVGKDVRRRGCEAGDADCERSEQHDEP